MLWLAALFLLSAKAVRLTYVASSVPRGEKTKINGYRQIIADNEFGAVVTYRTQGEEYHAVALKLGANGSMTLREIQDSSQVAMIRNDQINWLHKTATEITTNHSDYKLTEKAQLGDLVLVCLEMVNACPKPTESLQERLEGVSGNELVAALKDANKPCVRYAWLLLRVKQDGYRFKRQAQQHLPKPLMSEEDDEQVVSKLNMTPSLHSQRLNINALLLTGLDSRSDMKGFQATVFIQDGMLRHAGRGYMVLVLTDKWRWYRRRSTPLTREFTQLAVVMHGGDEEEAWKAVKPLIRLANAGTPKNRADLINFIKYIPEMHHYGVIQVPIKPPRNTM